MDEKVLGPEAAALQRAKLHIRGGKRRLRQGKVSAGIFTLYDALLSAMDWYIASPERRKVLLIKDYETITDDKVLFEVLTRSGVIEAGFDYEGFKNLAYGPNSKEMANFDYVGILKEFESVMTQLGVMPFDENELPPENPNTP
jgi:hypothetical protein